MQISAKKAAGVFIMTLLVFAIAAQMLTFPYEYYANKKHDSNTGGITAATNIVMEINFSKTTRLRQIGVALATYNRLNTCELDFYLYKNGEQVYTCVLPTAAVLVDNAYFDLTGMDVECTPQDAVWLRIASPETDFGNAVTLYYAAANTAQTASQMYFYNSLTGETAPIAGTPQLICYGAATPLSVLYRSYAYTGWLAVPLLAALATAILLLGKLLLPGAKTKEDNHETDHPDPML